MKTEKLNKIAIFWLKDIKKMNMEEIEKYFEYEKIFNEKGYNVQIKEIKDFHNSIFYNSAHHIGGYSVIRENGKSEIIDFIEFLEKNNYKSVSNF